MNFNTNNNKVLEIISSALNDKLNPVDNMLVDTMKGPIAHWAI